MNPQMGELSCSLSVSIYVSQKKFMKMYVMKKLNKNFKVICTRIILFFNSILVFFLKIDLFI